MTNMIPRGLLFNKLSQQTLQAASKRYLSPNSLLPRPQGKSYRLWSMPGDFVLRKDILAKQWTMKWHPGLNAGIDEERCIYALCDGIMIITEDQFDPDWTHPIVSKVYLDGEKKSAPLYKRYIHVIPKKRIPEFKLVDLV